MYHINELFYSLQGEGARAGTPNLFIRFSGCKAKDACAAYGVDCDTQFEGGASYTAQQLIDKCDELLLLEGIVPQHLLGIIATGGEPATQLDEALLLALKQHYPRATVCIETSGLYPLLCEPDYVVVSPKGAEHVIKKRFNRTHVNELRYVVHHGTVALPQPALTADSYFVSPHFDGIEPNNAAIQNAIRLLKQQENAPIFKLSLQVHKLLRIL